MAIGKGLDFVTFCDHDDPGGVAHVYDPVEGDCPSLNGAQCPGGCVVTDVGEVHVFDNCPVHGFVRAGDWATEGEDT